MTHTTADPAHTNRLIHETSPYLLQHAHNPVDWYPWRDEALERAKREDKLILLSIGYSACHWCHVMERESFSNPDIAALMNEHFVNIKVDREERPDLDDIYMAATVAMNYGQGGWPMTVFLTPDLEPVFAGTYYPPSDQYGRPGFHSLLTSIAKAWQTDRDKLQETADDLVEHLKQQQQIGPAVAVGDEELRLALKQFADDFDGTYGGFGSAPKFPPATGLSLLLRLYDRFGDPHARLMVQKTLYAMGQGGMYDQVGGGFHRYSTDPRWLVPHFEKMLYDNALLARTYLEAYQVSGDAFYRRIAVETLEYVLRDMTAPEGGFYSSTDADSEGEEGKFFVWTPSEVQAVLGEKHARCFNAYYDITAAGNWDGVSIPNTPRPIATVARDLETTPEELQRTLDACRPKIFEARRRRPAPGLDDKILTAWNGLMIGALAEGYRVLREPRYREAASRSVHFVLENLRAKDGRLFRTYRAGRAHVDAYLEDYAYLADALIDLYETGGDERHLRAAERLMERVMTDFIDQESGAFFSTAAVHEHLILRRRDGVDGATPAPNAAAAAALARLSYHLNRPEYRTAAIHAIKAYGRSIARHPRAFAKSLCVVDLLLSGPVELAFVGDPEQLDPLHREVSRHFLPNRIQAIHDPASGDAARLPLLRGKTAVDGRAALYVCRDFACQAPITDPADVARALADRPRLERAATSIAVRRAGRGTAQGTARYAGRFEAIGYVALGTTGLTASRLGFGCYRVHDENAEQREALLRALQAGVNVIDTSTNYMDGASERLVGTAIRELVDDGDLDRDEIVVVSKIGYLQGQNYELAQARETPFPEIVEMDQGLWHCIHPEFLADQLERSLDRLELETLDIGLLHNPEYFLADAARRGESVEASRDEFYRRLGNAFRWFESAVHEGRLGWYGVSSNTLTYPASHAEATSLTRMLDVARATGGNEHHFRVVQLPLNLFEAGAVFERNGGPELTQTPLEAAQTEQIAVLVNRPLNAFVRHTLVRLADVDLVEGEAIDFDAQANRVAGLEKAFREAIASQIEVRGGSVDPADFFRWTDQLRAARSRIRGLEQWAQVVGQVTARIRHIGSLLDQHLDGDVAQQWSAWRDQYLPELQRLMQELRREAASRARAQSDAIRTAIDPQLPLGRRGESLSRKALWTLTSTPGVTCVLCGMRRVEYVNDALGVLSWPPLENVDAVFHAAQAAKIGT